MSEPAIPPPGSRPPPGSATAVFGVLVINDPAGAAPLRAESWCRGLRVQRVRGLGAGLAALARGPFDCILLDLTGGFSEGYASLARLRASPSVLPVVVRVAAADADLGPMLIGAGAEDVCVASDAEGLLGRVLRHAIARARLRARTTATEAQIQGERERAGVGRLLAPPQHPGEAARIYGAATLRQNDPRLFAQIVEEYLDLVKHCAESQIFRVEPGETRTTRPLAERLGFLGVGPRDVIEIHTEALLHLEHELTAVDHRQVVLEGRIVVLELMGHLVGYYRRYYLNSMPLARDSDSAATRHSG